MAERVERELILPASREEVWETITRPGWLAAEVLLELRPGGEAHFAGPEGVRTGWVEEAVPPARLIFWWAEHDEETAGEASRVELLLDRLPDGATRLRVVEARPLELLDLVGIPLSGNAGARFGPALVAA
jgi:uncharacterized protein YndB with AHSA1/START domain